MTALVTNETQSGGGGGTSLPNATLWRTGRGCYQISGGAQDEKENLFSLCFTIVVA